MQKVKKFIQSINVSGVEVGTWRRALSLFLFILIYVLKVFGVELPVIDESVIGIIIIAVLGVIVFLQVFWKNNSLTKAAQEADKFLQEKKSEVDS